MIDLSKVELTDNNLRISNISQIIIGNSEVKGGEPIPPEPQFEMICGWKFGGKTNTDADRDVVKGLVGDIDLILHNFKFTPECGYDGNGYLVSDGSANVYIKSNKSFIIGDNYTCVANFEFGSVQRDENKLTGITKDASLAFSNILFRDGVIAVSMNSGDITNIASNGIAAASGNGKCYDKDWKEYDVTVGPMGDLQFQEWGIESFLSIFGIDAMDNSASGKIKNIAFFKGTSTKEECIQKYNYLQSL